MTSATQSNSGASWYLGCLSAFSGQPEVLASEHLADPAVQERIKRFLGAVNRSAGSSGWLNKMLLEYYGQYDGMVNYEALVIEANRELVAAGKNPLYALYPVDGLTIADSPLGYINKGDSKKETLFLKLQEYLMSEPIQTEIQKLGRRTGLVGLNPSSTDKQVFNPEWGIDLERILSPIRTPSGPVVREALTLYQTAFRKPSLTAFVLDYSGSMKGTGEQQLKQAMYTLLDPDEAARFLLQPSPQDVTLVIPFSSHPIAEWKVEGNDPEDLRRLLRNIQAQAADGGTQMYEATALAFRRLQSFAESGKYHCAAIVMSDGQSQGSIQEFEQVVATENLSRDIPIYTILFGKATEAQMKPLAESTTGKMFDGRKDVVDAFRQAKGYN